MLALEPGNTLAQTGLAWLRAQQVVTGPGATPGPAVAEAAHARRYRVGNVPSRSAWYARSLSIAGAALIVIGLVFAGPAVADFARSRVALPGRPASSTRVAPTLSRDQVSEPAESPPLPSPDHAGAITEGMEDAGASAPTPSSTHVAPTPAARASKPVSVTSSNTPEPTRTRTLAPTPTPSPTATPAPIEPTMTATAVLTPSRIVIPSVGIDGPVVASSLEIVEGGGVPEPSWVVPEATDAGWHDTSAPLGAPGNTVINGHNWPQDGIFRQLYTVEPGALVVLYSGETAFAYVVIEAVIVKEAGQEIEVRQANARRLLPTEDERLTIVTCHPYGSTRDRLIVTAVPVARGDGDADLLDGAPLP